jgi:hypothetical protein
MEDLSFFSKSRSKSDEPKVFFIWLLKCILHGPFYLQSIDFEALSLVRRSLDEAIQLLLS